MFYLSKITELILYIYFANPAPRSPFSIYSMVQILLSPLALLVALECIQVLVLLAALPAALENSLSIQLLQMKLLRAQIAKLERCVLFVKDNRTHTLHILC